MESCRFYKSGKPCALAEIYKKGVSSSDAIQDDFEVAESAFRVAISCKIVISVGTRCGSQTSCTSDRPTPAFCCGSLSLNIIVVSSAHSKKS